MVENLIASICRRIDEGRGLEEQTREPHTSILIIIISALPAILPSRSMHRGDHTRAAIRANCDVRS